MTDAQRETLQRLCDSYKVTFRQEDYLAQFDLPDGYVAGWVGGMEQAGKTLYVGVDAEGRASS